MPRLHIRPASQDEFMTAVDWAAEEGWNPGIDDLPAFHQTDPAGFLMGFFEAEPVSSISVVRYGSAFGFLGFYIVRTDMRGRGFGLATWQAGMAHLEGRLVGLDGVVDQQENYRKSGFILAGRNIRHSGIPTQLNQSIAREIRDFEPTDRAELYAYDRSFFAAPREPFLSGWTAPGANRSRITKIIRKKGNIAGYGVIRRCREGYKIGPLMCEDGAIADALFNALCDTMRVGSAVSLDTPEDNSAATELAVRYGLTPSFETARMYKGNAPSLPVSKIYGITTFELG